jgi:hypothetical protein
MKDLLANGSGKRTEILEFKILWLREVYVCFFDTV